MEFLDGGKNVASEALDLLHYNQKVSNQKSTSSENRTCDI